LSLNLSILFFISAGAGRTLLSALQPSIAGVITENFSAYVRERAAASLFSNESNERFGSSNTLVWFSEIASKSALYILSVAKLLGSGILALANAYLLFKISPQIAVIGVFGLFIGGSILWITNRLVSWMGKESLRFWRSATQKIESSSKNWLFLYSSQSLFREFSELKGLLQKVKIAGIVGRCAYELPGTLLQVIAFILMAALLTLNFQHNFLSPSPMLGFLYLFLRFSQTAAEVSRSMSSLHEYRPSVDQLISGFEAIDKPAPKEPRMTSKSSDFSHVKAPAIVLDTVDFGYMKGTKLLFQNLSLTIDSGQTVMISGPSGTGKSTLISLILGAIQPDSGKVTVNGRLPGNYIAEYAVGYVGAEPFLIPGTIRENLLYGSSVEFKDSELMEALRQACLTEFLADKEFPLDFRISDNLDGLSAGQKQRLCLARAFLISQGFIVLDEATANLDGNTEEGVIQSLMNIKGKYTILIVSHRPKLKKACDAEIKLAQDESGHISLIKTTTSAVE
jgi:ABC-type multidrug transport system fused ATPase/permease subunit